MLSSAPIVAGSSDAALRAVRLRLGLALLALLLMAALALVRALAEPSTGWQFDVGAQRTVQATQLTSPAKLDNVQSVRGVDCSGAPLHIPLDASLMRETGGIATYYHEHETFYAAHERIWTLLDCSHQAQKPVYVRHAGGETIMPLHTKALNELGLRFWFPWVFGLLGFSVGLAVWVYRPVDGSAAWYLLASASYAFWMMLVAAMGSRLLSHPAQGLQAWHLLCHLAGHLYLVALCILLWRFPSSLDRPAFRQGHLLTALLVWTGIFMLIDVMQWVQTINMGFRWPNLALAFVLALLFALQWRASQGDPLKRAPLRWLGFLLIITLSLSFFTTLFAMANRWTAGRMAYGFAAMSLIFIGFVPLVTQLKLFKLELWWTRAWLWFMGGILVVLLDVLLVRQFSLNTSAALGLALALAGWLYFPLRQWLWQRLSQTALPATSEVLPDIVALSNPQPGASDTQAQAWLSLWERQFQPQSLQAAHHPAQVEQLAIHDDGQSLHIPALGNFAPLQLGMPMRGARLYNLADLQRAREIHALVQRSLQARDALEQGAQLERQRIAADLHDDLGAKLLTIAQASQGQPQGARTAELARQALDDMRLAVRGLASSTISAAELQADWRAEFMQRLDAAGIEAEWLGNEPPAGMQLPAPMQVQLTRVLREAVSNVVRHSRAQHCQLRVQWPLQPTQELVLMVRDDGVGLPASQLQPGRREGLGLNNIERRIHKLGGHLQWQAVQPSGLELIAQIPLSPHSTSVTIKP